ITAFRNDNGVFSQDPNSPIAGLPAGSFSPTIVDLDYDGRYDIVFGDVDGSLHSWLNLSKSIAIVVAPENDRPTIVNGNETFLPDIAEDSTGPLGDTVDNLFGGHFADVDSAFGGIVLTGYSSALTTEGQWQYNDGTLWTAIGA